ncbi:MAG: ATP-binding protein [Magnetococcus sp. MYC-9]
MEAHSQTNSFPPFDRIHKEAFLAGKRVSNSAWIILFLSLISAITATSYVVYQREAEIIQSNKHRELASIAGLKIKEIVQWRQERLLDAERLGKSPVFARVVAEFLKDPNKGEIRTDLRQHLRVEQIGHVYAHVQLLTPEGRPLLAATKDSNDIDPATLHAIRAAIAGRRAVLSDFYRPTDGKIQLDTVTPVGEAEGGPAAVIVLSAHAGDYLYPLVAAWPTPSPSAETLLVMRDGEEVLFLNELRHRAGTALSMRIPITLTDHPSVQAVLGREGIFTGMDYRGIPVLANLMAIPGSSWFMVSKVDTSEILADMHHEANNHIAMVVLSILFTAAVLGFAYRRRQLTEAQINLRDREARFRLSQENALDAIITIDMNGRVEEFNPAAEALFGHSRESLLGQDMADYIIPPEFRQAHKDALLHHANHQEAWANIKRKVELPGLHADGHIIDLEVGLVSLSLGGRRFYTAFLRDITERKQLLKSLHETLEVAESANRMKSEFLANMSHEIRTPMNTIIGMTDLVLKVPLSRQEQRSNLEIVLQSSQSLLELINTILDFSKLDAGMIRLERVAFDLSGLLGKICHTLAIRAHQKGLELYCDIAPELPTTLLGDPLRLGQILLNLVNNAIKFTEEGEVVVRVEEAWRADREAGQSAQGEEIDLRFTVTDTGIGIDPERAPRIFDRFTQVDGSTTRKYGGTGLGLTISKHLVSLMGGRIGLDSAVGLGSRFHFTVRFGIAQRTFLTGTDPELEERRRSPVEDPLTGVRVLLADGHATGRALVKRILTLAGMEVEEAMDTPSWQRACRTAREEGRPFDLLVVDHGLLNKELVPPTTTEQRAGKAARILLLLPAHIGQDHVAFMPWLHAARAERKPVLKFPLLKTLRQLLRGAPAAEEALPMDTAVVRPETPLRILLVEDNPNNQMLATHILRHAGHGVDVANHGREGLLCLEKGAYDLVLMDVQMPEMDGMETTRRIRHKESASNVRRPLPIIAVTAKSTGEEEQLCLAAGMDGYLRKPYRAQELLAIIDGVVRTRQPESQQGTAPKSMGILKEVALSPALLSSKYAAFVHDFPRFLEKLGSALADRNTVQASRWAERTSEAAREIGGWQVSLQGMRLRNEVEQENWQAAREALERLVVRCQEVRQAILEKEQHT